MAGVKWPGMAGIYTEIAHRIGRKKARHPLQDGGRQGRWSGETISEKRDNDDAAITSFAAGAGIDAVPSPAASTAAARESAVATAPWSCQPRTATSAAIAAREKYRRGAAIAATTLCCATSATAARRGA